jgi:hypothetical protein
MELTCVDMAKRSNVGKAFWVALGSGFATGIVTYEHPQYLQLVWMAREFLEEPPTPEDIPSLTWQWCTYFPAAAAMRQRIVEPIGVVEIPETIRTPPLMRTGVPRLDNWIVVDADFRSLRKATFDDRFLCPFGIINDTMLIELLESRWKPEDWW